MSRAAQSKPTLKAWHGKGASRSSAPSVTAPIPVVLVSVSAASSATAGATGQTASATASSEGTYAWTVTGGTITAGQGTNAITYTAGNPGTAVLQCSVTDANGVTGSAEADVTIVSAPTMPIVTSASPVKAGTADLAASAAPQAGMTFAWTVTGGTITAGQGTNAITYTADGAGMISLSCAATNAAGTSKTGTVQVESTADGLLDVSGTYKDSYGITFTLFQNGAQVWGTRPVSSSISEAITATISGNILTGTFQNSDGNTGNFRWTFTPDAGSYAGLWASGSAAPTTAWNGTKQPGVSVQIPQTSPFAVMKTGTAQSFQAWVAGSLDKSVSWAASLGSVDANGQYTAPASPGNATITATSEADPTKVGTAKVQVTADGLQDVTGTYKDSYGITFTLFQNGAQVWGTRPVSSSISEAITATISGNILTGTFQNSDGSTGNFRWTFAQDASSYAGLWASGTAAPTTAWNGTKQAGVSVQISPTSALVVMKTGMTQPFQAWIAGSLDKSVAWTASLGSIDANGQYTAPASPGNATITATPEADPTKAVTARIEVTKDGILDVSGTYYNGNFSPFNLRIYQRGTALTIAADSMVWRGTLSGLTAAGTITASPTAAQIGTGFTLTFSADGSSLTGVWNTGPGGASNGAGASIVTHTRTAGLVSTWIEPSFQVAKAGTTAQVLAISGGSLDKNLTYTVTGGGSVAQDGTYTAPAYGCNAVVTATPEADPTKPASARVEVTGDGILDVSGTYYNGNFSPYNLKIYQQGTALTIFTDTASMVWKGTLNGLVATGAITSSTTLDYLNKGFTLTFAQDGSSLTGFWDTGAGGANNGAGTSIATHTRQSTVSLWLQPLQSTLYPTWSESLLVEVAGSVDKRLAWSVQEPNGGTVSAGGVYTAPATLGTFHVNAVSLANSSATATATIQAEVDDFEVLPAWIAMRPGSPASFAAMAKGVPVDEASWSVQEGAAGGSVDTAGRYTAPMTPGIYHLVATSLYDPTKKAVAEIHVGSTVGAYVTISPYTSQLGQGGTQQFSASVANAASTAVAWSCNGGSIDSNGLYTAPTTYGNYTVTATSVEDPTASDTATVIVSSGTGADKTFTYDLNGNMTSDGTRTFEWDAENRLVAVVKGTHRSEFGYDGFGHRVEIRELDADGSGGWTPSVDTKYVWDGAEIVESRSADGSTSLQRYFSQGFMDSDGTALYYTRDHHRSIHELVDAQGAIRARYDYDPYGRVTKISGDRDSSFLYSGYFWSSYANLYLTVGRAYDPSLGRWINRDPIEEDGGGNLYAYVQNSPIGFSDPSGLNGIDDIKNMWNYWDWDSFGDDLATSTTATGDGILGALTLGLWNGNKVRGAFGIAPTNTCSSVYRQAHAIAEIDTSLVMLGDAAFLRGLRAGYVNGIRAIPGAARAMAAEGSSLESAAKWAFDERNAIKEATREASGPIATSLVNAFNSMRGAAETTFESLAETKGFDGVIDSAGRSNQWINLMFGVR